MITVTQKGDFKTTEAYLARLTTKRQFEILNKYGSIGVAALSNATPKDTGNTSEMWRYTIVKRKGYYSIRWHNDHVENDIPIVVLIQYGHGTRNGGYVQGRDFIMPAVQPIFDQMAAEVWKEVTRV